MSNGRDLERDEGLRVHHRPHRGPHLLLLENRTRVTVPHGGFLHFVGYLYSDAVWSAIVFGVEQVTPWSLWGNTDMRRLPHSRIREALRGGPSKSWVGKLSGHTWGLREEQTMKSQRDASAVTQHRNHRGGKKSFLDVHVQPLH